MKLTTFTLLTLTMLSAMVVKADNPLPICYPGDATAYTKIAEVFSADGACRIWYCDAGHQWNPYYVCGLWSEITGATINHLYGLFQSSKTQKDTAWQTEATPTAQVVAGSADDRLGKLALSYPLPIDPPPSGWVTTDTKVYKQRAIVNGFTWKQFGTVPLGTPCYKVAADGSLIHTKVDGYYLIDLTVVTKLVKFDPLPTAAYAKCD